MMWLPTVDLITRIKEADLEDDKLFRSLLIDSLWELDVTLKELTRILGWSVASWLKGPGAPMRNTRKIHFEVLIKQIEKKRDNEQSD